MNEDAFERWARKFSQWLRRKGTKRWYQHCNHD